MKLAIVTPVYEDWNALAILCAEINEALKPFDIAVHVFAVDDGSPTQSPFDIGRLGWPCRIETIEIVRLACNLGHQRAIAVGLVAAADAKPDNVIVMDADGEDRPADIVNMLEIARNRPGHIICACRARRSENSAFKIFYKIYKLMFRLATGATIDFGNFCLIPADRLVGVIHSSSVWNHLAASIVRLRVPICRVATDRGKRYAGQSRMNFTSLVIHGLSAISAFSEVCLVRLLILCLALSVIITAGVVAVLAIKLFSALAIPGWATTAIGALMMMLFQTLVMACMASFMLLNSRKYSQIIPALDATRYILDRRTYRITGHKEVVNG